MPTRRARMRRKVLHALPEGFIARPEAAFLAILCFGTGIPTALGITQSQALYQLLPTGALNAWGVALLVGSAAVLSGILSIEIRDGYEVIKRAAAYRLGLRLLGLASVVYGFALIVLAGTAGLLPAGWVWAFAVAMWVRLATTKGVENIKHQEHES